MQFTTESPERAALPDLEEGLFQLLDVAARLCAEGFRPGIPHEENPGLSESCGWHPE